MKTISEDGTLYKFANGVTVYRRHLLEEQITRYQSEGNSNRHEPVEEYWLESMLKVASVDSPLVYDVGAAIGYYVLLILKLCPAARIKAFEPLPEHFSALKENLALNRIVDAQVICSDAAVYNRDAILEFEGLHFASHLIDAETPYAKGNKLQVTAKDIAGLIAQEVAPVDMIKLDVQGSEVMILERVIGAGYVDRVNSWLIGTHGPVRHARCLELLEPHWRIVHQDPAPAFQPDGLIVASSVL